MKEEEFIKLKPSQLLRLALSDIEKVSKDGRYDIDMNSWHRYEHEGEICFVCLAGAVIAKSFEKGWTREITPSKKHFPNAKVTDQLVTIDLIRRLWFDEMKDYKSTSFDKDLGEILRKYADKFDASDEDLEDFLDFYVSISFYKEVADLMEKYEEKK